jgi:hypothetical protein
MVFAVLGHFHLIIGKALRNIRVIGKGVLLFMRRGLSSCGLFLLVTSATTLGFGSLAINASAATAPPAKSKPKPKAASAKPPKLSGETVESEALDMRFVIPDGWKPFNGRIIGVPQGAKVVSYNLPKFILQTEKTRYYYPPQFFALSMELPETEKMKNLTPAQQDAMMQEMVSSFYKTQPNFRAEGMARVTVNGEPATACAYVNTGSVTGDILRHRVIGMLRNHKLYMFGFIAEVDDFPNYAATFAKILQNFHFLTPRKEDAPPAVAPENAPEKKDGVF